MKNHQAWLKTLPQRLRQARERAGLTLKVLADAVGVDLTRISEYERGKRLPALPTAAALADRLGIELFPRR